MCNNKNPFKFKGNITEAFFSRNTRPDNYHSWSCPKISHELQKAQNINFRCQTVFPLGTQLLSQSLLHYSLRQKQFLVISLYSSSFFSLLLLLYYPAFLFSDVSSYSKPFSYKSFPLKYPSNFPPIFLVHLKAEDRFYGE